MPGRWLRRSTSGAWTNITSNQGQIDGLMRDALSYASPQRIAVDMGMAEAGVQQAAERGRKCGSATLNPTASIHRPAVTPRSTAPTE